MQTFCFRCCYLYADVCRHFVLDVATSLRMYADRNYVLDVSTSLRMYADRNYVLDVSTSMRMYADILFDDIIMVTETNVIHICFFIE